MTREEQAQPEVPKSRIPTFKTIEEEAAFWDTHSSEEFAEEPPKSHCISLHPDIPCLLQVGARIALEGHQRMCLRDGRQVYHARCNDIGQIFIVLQSQQRNEVILSCHRIDLRHSIDLQQRLGRLVHLPTLHIDEH